MRLILIGSALFSASILLFAACIQDPGNATSSTSGTGGAPNCEGVYMVYGDKDGGHPCDICLHEHCCPELSECRDKSCIDCVNYLVPSCGPEPRVMNDCMYAYCQPTCSPGWPPTATVATGGP